MIMAYYNNTPWGYIHQKRKFKEFIKKLESRITEFEEKPDELIPQLKKSIEQFKKEIEG